MILEGGVALVTGGASGLGAATVERLRRDGAQVVLLDLPDAPGALVAERTGSVFAPADVRDTDAVAAAVAAATGLGPLRVVVNCAGVGDPARTLGRDGPLDLERFRRIVEINLIGTFNVLRLGAAAMAGTPSVNGERGVVVNTASAAAFDGQIGQASYSASKAAIAGMTLPIARDLARSLIRVVSIAPGMFETPILDALSAEARASIAAQVPHPSRLGRPAEFADLVAHVIANPMLNGETIRLDGAIRLAPR
ncbi:SDR family NAD(P)-dependent oxidoreductase [Amycolatopsis sp. K13G38]|uniref:SDR family NAD(P)-dependent oxidoreductase n=1 Tax=Amycolatopsis acididurans TaxID=2724524 RepID=A0ABX1JBU0_9PSEU|nr:SDR family NAD(P)-dependent oxidoreductase [Amycolatopsis acididurans]NKQ57216.1 SDR family NAD(P)-dependent oxidoreductase [Amycolatopsis acididurans]